MFYGNNIEMQTRAYVYNADLLNWTLNKLKTLKKLLIRKKPANWFLYTKRKPGSQKLFFFCSKHLLYYTPTRRTAVKSNVHCKTQKNRRCEFIS